MKNVLTTTLIVASLGLVSFNTVANELNLIESFKTKIASSAKKIGISPKSYLLAGQLLERLDDPGRNS